MMIPGLTLNSNYMTQQQQIGSPQNALNLANIQKYMNMNPTAATAAPTGPTMPNISGILAGLTKSGMAGGRYGEFLRNNPNMTADQLKQGSILQSIDMARMNSGQLDYGRGNRGGWGGSMGGH